MGIVRGEGTTVVSEMVFPALMNHHGTFFAGEALKLMVKAAFIAGSRDVNKLVVIAAVERTDFLHPIVHGDLAEVLAQVVERGRTSLVVACELYSEHFQTGARTLCGTGRFTIVAVDANGRPTPRIASLES